MKNRFSSRTAWDLSESNFAAAVRRARSAEVATGRRLIDLTVSNPTLCGFSYDAKEILQPLGAAEGMIYDPDARGIRSARQAVADYYADHEASVNPDSIVLTTSTSEAYGYLFRLLCDAGDEVLVAQPSYPLFDFLADLEDVRLRTYPLFYDFGWWIDFAELERRIGPRTKAILVVHPNNPTGHWTGRQERERLCALCLQYGLALIVDEVFLDYPIVESPDAATFASEENTVLTFILSGMSKIAGLPQMKAAWIVTLGPEELQQEALNRLEIIADTFLSMNAPVQIALPRWLATRHGIQKQILTRIRTNLGAAATSGIAMLHVEAGWSAVVRQLSSAEEVLKEQGVVTHPGSFYGMTERNRLVVSLIGDEEEFALGTGRLR